MGLRYSKLAVEVKLELELRVMGNRHDNHIPLTILCDEDRGIGFVDDVRDFIRFITQIRNGFDDGHTWLLSSYQNTIT
jgi:hypothetical protein